ncbi:MAG: metal-dependent hydrolase, partial [Anaerolineae bacterium]
EARVKVGVPMVHTYDAETRIDIFSGPSFKFERRGDRLHIHFLDWHRRWSHSLTLAAAVGLVAGLLFGKWAGIVAGLGFAGHVLEDQLGFMGSNLFYPFTKGRSTGLQLLRSGDTIPNFLTVWTSVALILFNLDRFSAQPRLHPSWFLGLAVVLPVAVLGGLYQWQRQRGKPEPKESLRQRDIVAEAEEMEVG